MSQEHTVSDKSVAKRLYCQSMKIALTSVKQYCVEDGVWLFVDCDIITSRIENRFGFVVDTEKYPQLLKYTIPKVIYKNSKYTEFDVGEQHFVCFTGLDSMKILWLSLNARKMFVKHIEKKEVKTSITINSLYTNLKKHYNFFLNEYPNPCPAPLSITFDLYEKSKKYLEM